MRSTLSITEKCRLFVMMNWIFIKWEVDVQIFAEIFTKRPELKPVFLQLVALFTISLVSSPYGDWGSRFKPIFMEQIASY